MTEVQPPVPAGAALWLIRHGSTEWSENGRHTGRTDLPLTPSGEAQARALGDLLEGLRFSFVLSSPRQRALRTAELAGVRVDAIDDDAAEWDYGDYEGLTSPEIQRTAPGWTIWSGAVPGGESIPQIQQRADRVLARLAPHLDGGPVAVIAHGHFNRVLAARWLQQPAEFGAHLILGTAAPCVLGEEHGVPAIVHWNIANSGLRSADSVKEKLL
jgi:probable phosphoglycerate mutase